ncbi:MAG: A24 family peptidase C-terminal domain-containing protein [Candidatus Methanoperedens sp.]|nr:A24 family peptidase C-terminal domain-containing protein [Candidatus Methanoperedens sp.]
MLVDMLKILFCIPFLLYSCYTDIKTRRVVNRVWVIMLSGWAFFVISDTITKGVEYLPRLLISAGFIFVFVYILFQFGTFGGADAKALIVLSIILPAYPSLHVFGYTLPLKQPLIDIFALGIFGNAVLLTIIVPIGLAIINLIKTGMRIDKPHYIFIGYKTGISNLAGRHIRLMQDFKEINGTVQTQFKRGGVDIDEGIVHKLKNLSEKGLIDDEVWVTPSLPFMIPITAGFFVAVIYGDLIFELTRMVFV